MFRFSRDKRFLSAVSFWDFVQTGSILVTMTQAARPNATAKILTTEDAYTHRYSQVTFMAEEVTEALKRRKPYALEEFTEEVWNRSMSVQLTLKDDTDRNSFMMCLSLDRRDEPRSMKFYGQDVEPELVDRIRDTFSYPSFFYKIGDGFSKPSDFNLAFGQRLTGIRLM